MTKSKRLALIICIFFLVLVVFYYAMKLTTPKECNVPVRTMSQWCKDFIYSK